MTAKKPHLCSFLVKVRGVREAQCCLHGVNPRSPAGLSPCIPPPYPCSCPCIPPRHPWHLPAARLCRPCMPRGTVAMLAAPATAGVTPPLTELLLLPGATGSAGLSRHLCTRWLRVEAGRGPLQGASPRASRGVGARSRVPQREFGAGEGTPCPGVRQSRAEAPVPPSPSLLGR